MVWPGMNQVLLISWRRSSSRIRAVPTMPKSPREIMVGVVISRAMAPEALSWSKVRQTKCCFMAVSGCGCDMRHRAPGGIEDVDRARRGARGQRCAGLDGGVARNPHGDIGPIRQMHEDIA